MTSRGKEYKDVQHHLNKWGRFPKSASLEPDVAVIPIKDLEFDQVEKVVTKGTGIDITKHPPWPQDASNSPKSLADTTSRFKGYESSIHDNFIKSLRHPRLLGAFVYTEQKNNGTAMAALDGDTAARNRIAETFLWQFLDKYKHRYKSKNLPGQGVFASLLHDIAADTYNEQDAMTQARWERVAVNSQISKHEASELFEEAASGGLISIVDETSHDPEWNWKHLFVALYLKTARVKDYCPR